MSFPTYLFSSHRASAPPAKNASEVLNNTLAPDGVKKPFSVLDKLVIGKPPVDASKEESLKKIEKEKRNTKFMAITGALIGAALAIYKRQAIVSGFQKIFSDKQPIQPVMPEPAIASVTNKKPLASSPFVVEIEKTAGHSK